MTPLFDNKDFSGGLRPHGIAFHPDQQKLSFINRAAFREGKKWRLETQLVVGDTMGVSSTPQMDTTHCAANDVTFGVENLLVSIDHSACGASAFWEDVFSLKKSGVLAEDDEVLGGVGFANGLVKMNGGNFAVAATRSKEILVFDREGNKKSSLKVKGGPDNLTVRPDGKIIAALHLSLMRMGLYRKMGIGKAPSKIVRVDLKTEDIALLFSDKSGDLFAGATVGVEVDDVLIAGSVLDQGLLVCQNKDAR